MPIINKDYKAEFDEKRAIERQMEKSVWLNPTQVELSRVKSDHVELPYLRREIIKFCDNCRTVSYGEWRYSGKKRSVRVGGKHCGWECVGEYPKSYKEDEDYVDNITQCPWCGGRMVSSPFLSIQLEDGDYYSCIESDTGISRRIRRIIEAIYTRDHSAAAKKVEENIESWDISASISVPNSVHIIKNSPQQLMEYLLQLIHLESSIYGLSQRLEVLYYNATQLEHRAICDNHISLPFVEARVKEAQEKLDSMKLKLEDLSEEAPPILYPQEPKPPVYKPLPTFFQSKTIRENARAQLEYSEAMKKYKEECSRLKEKEKEQQEKANREVARRKSQETEIFFQEHRVRMRLSELAQAKVIASLPEPPSYTLLLNIEKEIAEVEKLLQGMFKAKNELYAYNIVYGKYRDIVALTTFYEYLMSGRCSSLEGPDGAYNIYENEIRMNMIVSQLSTVIEKLETIKQGQYLLYSELHSINSSISSLNAKMDNAIQSLNSIASNTAKIADNTEQIAYNTEVTAFYAKKNAELTDALGYMVAFK